MSEPLTLSVVHTLVYPHAVAQGPGYPSEILREHEARLIAELARMAHAKGHRFDGWPKIELVARDYLKGGFYPSDYAELRASVKAVAR